MLVPLLDAMPSSVAVLDENGTIIHVNRAWREFAFQNGCTDAYCGVGSSYLTACGGDETVRTALDEVVSGERHDFRCDYPCHGPDEKRWFQMRICPLEIGGNKWFLTIHENVTEIKVAEEELWRLSHLDEVTGLPNRTYFLELLNIKLDETDRNVALVLLAIDGFEKINALFGDAIGNRILANVASAVGSDVLESELFGHWNWGKFAFAFECDCTESGIEDRARALVEVIQRWGQLEGFDVPVTVRMGLTKAPRDGADAAELAAHAELALQKARGDLHKRLFFDRTVNAAVEAELAIEAALSRAIERKEFILHYQPQVDGRTKSLVGVEALIRWLSPSEGLVPPDKFIPIAERHGTISRIGEWVLAQACRDIKRWNRSGLREIPVAVNVSPYELADPAFSQRVARILDAYEVDPVLVELELTETALLQRDAVQCETNLAQLRAIGVRLAIDDFGTGFSNLNRIQTLQVDRIKIDRSFLPETGLRGSAAAIVDAVVRLGRNLGVDVLAEGVENEQQVRQLLAHRCPTMQGYYFARPMPAAELEKWILTRPNRQMKKVIRSAASLCSA